MALGHPVGRIRRRGRLPWLPVIVPDVLDDGGPRVRRLPTVKAYGPNLVCEQYAWISSWRVFTAQKVFVLGPDDQQTAHTCR